MRARVAFSRVEDALLPSCLARRGKGEGAEGHVMMGIDGVPNVPRPRLAMKWGRGYRGKNICSWCVGKSNSLSFFQRQMAAAGKAGIVRFGRGHEPSHRVSESLGRYHRLSQKISSMELAKSWEPSLDTA